LNQLPKRESASARRSATPTGSTSATCSPKDVRANRMLVLIPVASPSNLSAASSTAMGLVLQPVGRRSISARRRKGSRSCSRSPRLRAENWPMNGSNSRPRRKSSALRSPTRSTAAMSASRVVWLGSAPAQPRHGWVACAAKTVDCACTSATASSTRCSSSRGTVVTSDHGRAHVTAGAASCSANRPMPSYKEQSRGVSRRWIARTV
jgi:hypothetical protein